MTQDSQAVAPSEDEQPTFDILPLSEEVRKAVDALGYTHPTPLQRAVFEPAGRGADLVVQARTGTGKTAAFGLPIIDRIVKPLRAEPQVLVLSPTRELALQISRELEGLAKFTDTTCTAVYGGAAMQPQIDAIKKGAQVIVGTPGRVLDHLERGTLSPSTIKLLVLDESDEMLSMGFLPQITKVMEQLPDSHQTLLFSATVPQEVRRIAETRLTDPEFITLSGDHVGALSIEHYVYRSRGQKADELVKLIEIENPESAIVFCNTRDQTKRLAEALKREGFAADWLNADLSQADREKVMAATRESRLRFLVATDVAARGIDISHLTHVINADFPESTENYVHRTGRTGRAGRTGTAISLVTPQDVGNLYILRLTYKIFPVERELPSDRDLQTRQEADLVRHLIDSFSRVPLRQEWLSLARRILASEQPELLVAGLLDRHLEEHPNLATSAAEERRTKMPEPVKAKKGKTKSKDKGSKKKKHKDQDRTSEEPHAAAAVEDGAASKGAVSAPAKVSVSKAPAPAEPVDLPSTSGRRTTKRRPRDDSHDAPSRGHTDDLEVVSADDILRASGHKSVEEALEADGDRGDVPKKKRGRSDQAAETSRGPHEAEAAPGRTSFDDADEDEGRIFIDVGKRDGAYRDDFLDVLEDEGFDLEAVHFVKLRDTHSFVGVPAHLLETAIDALDGARIAGCEAKAEKARPRRR